MAIINEGTVSTTDWIAHIKENGNAALKEIYFLYRGECVEWLRQNHNLREVVAKDAFQLSMIILYQNVVGGKLEYLTSGLKTYLFGIAKNKARDLLRSESRYNTQGNIGMITQDMTHGIEDKERFEMRLSKVQRAMIKMGDPCKSILQLFYFKRLSMKDIALMMGHRSSESAKNQKYKCLKRLNKMVSDQKLVPLEN